MKNFFSRSRNGVLVVILTAIIMTACFKPDWLVTPADARTPHIESLQDKMVHYMKSRNKDLPDGVAYKLANAIVTQKYKYNIPVELQLAQATVESNFDQYALGADGELGFFQIHAKWHVDRVRALMRAGDIKTKNIYDAQTNVAIAMSKLNECTKKFNGNIQKGLQCYNGIGADAKIYASKVITLSKSVKQQI